LPINWGLESMKWRLALDAPNVTALTSFFHILRGISMGIITPARIGEYAGRSVWLESSLRSKGTLATFLCSVSQNTIHLVLGFLALLCIPSYTQDAAYSSYFSLLLLVLIFVLVVCYWKTDALWRRANRMTWIAKRLKRWNQEIHFEWKFSQKGTILLLSFLRLLVYSFQYILILYALGAEPFHMIELIAALSLIFAFHSLVPLAPFFQLPFRGSIAIFFLSPLIVQESIIFTSSYLIWLINLIIPAIIGTLLFLRSPKTSKQETM